jgi:putative DNA primase/helicase
MLSWVHDIATYSPILLVTSAEADSGKTTLLGIIAFLAKRALASVSISGPALFRSIAKWEPTMIVDEGDTAFVNNEDLRAVFNSGWTRHQGVIRCDPETHEPRMYSTFCPKALGTKGKKLPDTTMSRCIIIETKRKRADEQVEDFDHEDDSELAELRRRLARWSFDNAQSLRKANPDMPSGFINRTRMNWRMLLAIAAAACDDAERRAHGAAKEIEGSRTEITDTSLSVELLRDLRAVFGEEDESQLPTRAIISGLVGMEEKPWSEYGRAQKPISPKQLATLLKPFGIHSREIHEHDSHTKGYKREQFEDVWKRYLPPSVEDLPRSRANLDKSMAYDDFAAARDDDSARDETGHNSLKNKESRGCAGKNNPRAAPKEKNG